MAMTERPHLFPSRTQKLSSPVSMVLGPQGPGRVDRRQVTKSDRRDSIVLFYTLALDMKCYSSCYLLAHAYACDVDILG